MTIEKISKKVKQEKINKRKKKKKCGGPASWRNSETMCVDHDPNVMIRTWRRHIWGLTTSWIGPKHGKHGTRPQRGLPSLTWKSELIWTQTASWIGPDDVIIRAQAWETWGKTSKRFAEPYMELRPYLDPDGVMNRTWRRHDSGPSMGNMGQDLKEVCLT